MAVNKNMKVLVVDDYATMRRILRNLLNQLGFNNVEMASDGPSALTMLLTDDYGLVIADWDMEPVTGFQLLKEVRALAYSAGKAKRPFRNQRGTCSARGWMAVPDVILGRCSKPCRRPHVDADHPRAA